MDGLIGLINYDRISADVLFIQYELNVQRCLYSHTIILRARSLIQYYGGEPWNGYTTGQTVL